MSRTKRGEKGPGFEYWSKRAGPKMMPPGSIAKKLTHRAERQEAILHVLEKPEQPPRHRPSKDKKRWCKGKVGREHAYVNATPVNAPNQHVPEMCVVCSACGRTEYKRRYLRSTRRIQQKEATSDV